MANLGQFVRNLVDNGATVYAGNPSYRVIKDDYGRYLIKCAFNGHMVGLDSDNLLNANCLYYFYCDLNNDDQLVNLNDLLTRV